MGYKQGNHWKEVLIGKSNAVLLSDGNRIRLRNGSSFVFRSVPLPSQRLGEPSMVQYEDAKVRFKLLERDRN